MAIKVSGTTVIDDSRSIINVGVATVGLITAKSTQTENLNVSGIATVANLNSTSSSSTNLRVSGVSTLGTVSATSYTGDGSQLSGINVGVTSEGSVIGYGFTTINFVGTGNSIRAEGNTVHVKIAGGGAGGGSPAQSFVYASIFG